MGDVLVLGMAAVDFVFSVESLPNDAIKYRAENADIVGGGNAANAAVAIARLGATPIFMSRLGNDQLADLVLGDLQANGVATKLIHRARAGRSSFSSVYIDARGERQIMNFRGSGLTDETGWIAQAPRANAVLVDTRWADGAAAALDLAQHWGVPGILDGEAPVDPRLLAKASHVAFSAQGLASLVQDSEPAKALERLAARSPGWVCVTDGENGVWYTTTDGIAHVPAFQVDVKDTLAAGDVWHGAFALALAEAQAAPAAIRFANATAALKCMTFGGRSGTPDRASVEAFLKENE